MLVADSTREKAIALARKSRGHILKRYYGGKWSWLDANWFDRKLEENFITKVTVRRLLSEGTFNVSAFEGTEPIAIVLVEKYRVYSNDL
jgi:hypothetical protein